MKNIVLFQKSVVRENLSFDKANEIIKKANASPCATHFRFSMYAQAGQGGKTPWSVVAIPIQLEREFLDNPDDFVIQVDD